MENHIDQDNNDLVDNIKYLTDKLFEEYEELINEGIKISRLTKGKLEEINKKTIELIEYKNKTHNMLNDDAIITFNVSGNIYSIKGKLLLKYSETLFFELIASNAFEYSKEIILDRPSKPFGYILRFYRDGSLPIWELNKNDLNEIMIESNYFQIDELTEYIQHCLNQY